MILKNNDFSCKLIINLHLICKINILYVNYTEHILESLNPTIHNATLLHATILHRVWPA